MSDNPFKVLENRLIHLESLLLDIKYDRANFQPAEASKTYLNITELSDYLPSKPSRSTIYRWVHNRQVPFHKKAKSLYFIKAEIDTWLDLDLRRSRNEIQQDAHLCLNKKGG